MNRMSDYKAFMRHVPSKYRKRAAKFFLDAVRLGAEDVIAWVFKEVEIELAISEELECDDCRFLRDLKRFIANYGNVNIVAGMANWAIWWRSLTPTEREVYRQSVASTNEPVTEEQALYIVEHGLPVPSTYIEAEIMIRAIAGGRVQEAKKSHFRNSYG